MHDALGELGARQATRRGVRTYRNLEQVLGDERVEGVYLLTPPATHAELGLRSLDAEKHVLVEKPVSPSQEDLEGVPQVARETDQVVMLAHDYAHMPEFRRIDRLARSGDLGKLRAAWITYAIKHRPEVLALRGGAFEDLMIHEVYLTLAMLGWPTRVWACTADAAGTEDQACLPARRHARQGAADQPFTGSCPRRVGPRWPRPDCAR